MNKELEEIRAKAEQKLLSPDPDARRVYTRSKAGQKSFKANYKISAHEALMAWHRRQGHKVKP